MSNYNRIKNDRIAYSDLLNKITKLKTENNNLKSKLNKINQESVSFFNLMKQNLQLKTENDNLKFQLNKLKETEQLLKQDTKRMKKFLSYIQRLEKRINDFEDTSPKRISGVADTSLSGEIIVNEILSKIDEPISEDQIANKISFPTENSGSKTSSSYDERILSLKTPSSSMKDVNKGQNAQYFGHHYQ